MPDDAKADGNQGTSGVPRFVVDARIGPALLLKSQSKVPRHLIKPELRLGGRMLPVDRWELGLALEGLLDASEHYRVLGLVAHARYAALEAESFSLGVSAALGAGYDADILHSDLAADASVAPYYFLALDARWQHGPFLIGTQGAIQNLAIVQLGLLV